MKPAQRNITRFLCGVFLLIFTSFLFPYIAGRYDNIRFGKDDGLVFLVSTRIISSAFFFWIIIGKAWSVIPGAMIGLLVYVLYVLLGGAIVYKSVPGDQLIVSAVIALFGWFYFRRRNRTQSQKNF